MSIVQFLEALGASSIALSPANYANAVEALGLDEASRIALMACDADAVNRVLAGREETRCFIFVPD